MLEGSFVARIPKPWFREDRQAWYVTINGERHNLGPDEKEARRRFHELMARPEPQAPAPARPEGLTVARVFDKFLDWCQKHCAPRTYDWYLDHIQSFLDTLQRSDQMAATSLKPFHVVEWADAHSDWGSNFRYGAIVGIQRPFNWAEKLGYIPASPLRHIEKPPRKRREQVVTPEEWPAIRDHYPEGDAFRDILEFAWETGCRPHEAKTIEARHVQLDRHCVVFPPDEAKGKRRRRTIHLTPRAEQILARLLARRPQGLLFLNADGRPWTAFAMNCRFCRLKKHLGVKYAAYSLRHGFATRKLEDGLDHLTVAALMGHADGTMLARVYSHVGERQDYLREKLNGSADG
jgi:integrase